MTDETERPGDEPEKPFPAHPIDLAAELFQPDITEKLLNAQLAEALFMMRDAGYLYRNCGFDANERGYFIQHTQAMMEVSAKIADRLAQMNGGGSVAEKRFRYIVERVENSSGGGGSEKTKND